MRWELQQYVWQDRTGTNKQRSGKYEVGNTRGNRTTHDPPPAISHHRTGVRLAPRQLPRSFLGRWQHRERHCRSSHPSGRFDLVISEYSKVDGTREKRRKGVIRRARATSATPEHCCVLVVNKPNCPHVHYLCIWFFARAILKHPVRKRAPANPNPNPDPAMAVGANTTDNGHTANGDKTTTAVTLAKGRCVICCNQNKTPYRRLRFKRYIISST